MIKKLVVFNFTVLCAILAATYMGFVIPLFLDDITYISYAIVVLCFWGLVQIFWAASKPKNMVNFEGIRDIATYLVQLGIVGTAAGVLITFSAAAVGTGDAASIKEFAKTVFTGAKVAFHCTIVGILCNMWIRYNSRIVLKAWDEV